VNKCPAGPLGIGAACTALICLARWRQPDQASDTDLMKQTASNPRRSLANPAAHSTTPTSSSMVLQKTGLLNPQNQWPDTLDPAVTKGVD
jgi:hypothetical protein